MTKPPVVSFDIGETFLMKVPLPEDMYDTHGDSFVVEATYEGMASDTEVEKKKDDGSMKEIYNCLNFTEHHIVSFGNTMWVNDFIEPDDNFHPTPLV